ncbi:MAG: tol-pal system protein YbgF [Deferribacteres bacterium]|nr:tol-pal system protein YbgF [candidate division KSB1 bacterium]MCB9508934.1 tol-pal system protein YbgF [Deferribacteres bacterium]
MMKARLLAATLIAGYTAFGCATATSVREVKQDTATVRTQLEAIRDDQRRIAQALVKLQSLVQQSSEEMVQMRAELKLELDRLGREADVINARLQDTDQRISRLPSKIQAVPSVSLPDSTRTDNTVQGAQTSAADAKSLYDAAYQDLVKGQYSLAESGFQQYLQMVPNGELSDNALYWIGECHYAQQQFDQAALAFKDVERRYPEGDKLPAALLKLGYSQIALGQQNSASATLQDLVRKYPFSNEAKLAQDKIRELR